MRPPIPELLIPAGSLEKLKLAVSYGADAVYLGGEKFGLRHASDNFSEYELRQGVSFAHQRCAKVYVVLNSFLHDDELDELPDFLAFLESIGTDAVIVSDLGVVESVRAHSSLPIHLSTQASCLNSLAAMWWKKAGIERIILGREVALDEAKTIGRIADAELEMFIHGSLCMAYSGHCVISNYTQGRDSNRGGCAHSCRFEYALKSPSDSPAGTEKIVAERSSFMSSKDLQGLFLIPEFVRAGIASVKIEGRMKSHHYVGTVTKVYRQALDAYKNGLLESHLKDLGEELEKLSHRGYCSGNLAAPAGVESVADVDSSKKGDYRLGAVVLEALEGRHLTLEVRSAFVAGSLLEWVPFCDANQVFSAENMTDLQNRPLESAKLGQVVKIPWRKGAKPLNIIRICPPTGFPSQIESARLCLFTQSRSCKTAVGQKTKGLTL